MTIPVPATQNEESVNDISKHEVASASNGAIKSEQGEAAQAPSFLNERSRGLEIDGIRGLLKYETPGVVSFLAGKPNPQTFPFESITLNLKPPLGSASGSNSESSTAAEETTTPLSIDGTDLWDALQYGPTPGLITFRNWLENLQETVHKRKNGGEGGEWGISVGTGSQDMMTKCFHAVVNRGDPVLLEAPLYAGVLPCLKYLEADMVESSNQEFRNLPIEVDVDEYGMSATGLEKILAEWPEGKTRPRVVYCCPTGCNPSGCSATAERKLEVLKVCKKYEVLIMEDDPYYYLAETLTPSYFELEPQVIPGGGYVIRFDSVSKLLSAGLRIGFATGPQDILAAIDVNSAMSNLHTSSISQAVAYRLLKHWGTEGFLAHSRAVAQFYADRREKFEAAAHKHLDGLATWVSPVAGMFLWIDLSISGITDTFDLIRKEALAKGVLAVPGFSFYPSGRKSSHVRTSFSLVDLEVDADLGFQRLAEAIRDKRKQLGLE